MRVCRLFCSLAVIELSGVRPPSSFSRVSPRPPARVTQCSVTAPGPGVRRRQQPGRQSLGEGRKRHPAPGFGDLENLCLRNRRGRMLIPHIHLLAAHPSIEAAGRQEGGGRGLSTAGARVAASGSGSPSSILGSRADYWGDGNHRCLLP